jgi:hypothetical protein
MSLDELTAKEVRYKTPGAVRNVKVDMTAFLDEGETLDGTPTITEPDGIETASAAVSTQALKINDTYVEAGKAITFTVSGGTKGEEYRILVSCDTSGGQTVEGYVRVGVDGA